MRWLVFAIVGPVMWFLGIRLWIVLICWIPFAAFIVGFWTYMGKYLVPPKLEKCKADAGSFQDLGLGSR